MPYLELMVNVQVPDEKALALEFSKLGAQTLGKPEAYITVSITYNKTLTFGGTFDPAFALTITSLDNLNTEANEKYSLAFSEFFKEKLNIPNDRGYITFNDPGRGFLGFKGTTFATIFAKS
ncbi:Tautomerase/MIF superfamily [Mycena alexandri]|uniref:L-dopachrome isomerase n=1 Tax=Mycena alexandri TaxID=1745969 RepID=A0AAD6XAT7_9AGAR|nr:Tautomerase/MIF superfamily [Mycena alexandri]